MAPVGTWLRSLLDCLLAVHPAAIWTALGFVRSGGPGAQNTATTLLVPSTDRFPLAGVALATLIIFPATGGLASKAQLADTAYQSGSEEASSSLSRPSVRHGRRPTVLLAGNVGEHVPAAMPSDAVPALPGDSGQGKRPGKSFPRSRTSFTT